MHNIFVSRIKIDLLPYVSAALALYFLYVTYFFKFLQQNNSSRNVESQRSGLI